MRDIFYSLIFLLLGVSFFGGSDCSPLHDYEHDLPSITYDTLVGYIDPKYQDGHSVHEIDSEPAESVPGPISGPIMGYTAYRLVKSMMSNGPTDPMSTILYYSPFRVASRVANGMGNVGKTFVSTFSTEFQKSYDALSTGIKNRVGGINTNVEGDILTSQPHRASFSESAWMDGI